MSLWDLFCCKNTDKRKSDIVKSKTLKSQTQQVIHKKIQKKDKYIGEELNGKPHGNGIMMYQNGDYFQGQWVQGMKQGRGLHVYNQLGQRYQGQWKNDQRNGSGKITFGNGSFFVGEFRNGKKNGKGQLYDFEQKKTFVEIYQNDNLVEKKQIINNKQKQQQFPTLVLDKQRFTNQDLQRFQQANPQIKQFGLDFLLKYYGLCKVINLDFIDINIKEWTIKQVLTFLTEIGLKQYQEIFYKNKIKGDDLLTLQERQMKEDLKMKLGDRKRLANYIKYLKGVYQTKQKKVQTPIKRKKSPRNLLIPKNYKSQLNSLQNPVIKQQSDQEWKQCQSPSQIGQKNNPLKLEKISSKNQIFATENWGQDYNSGCFINRHSLCEEDFQQISKDKINVSQAKRTDEENQALEHYGRKISDEKISEKLKNSIGKKSGSEKSSSESSISEQDLSVIKKKKSTGHSMEIRQLYEFLREHKGLDLMIKAKDIEILGQIGQGGYGKVYKGKYMSCPVAVKDYLKAERLHRSRDDFMKQVQVLSQLKHPNIVLFMGMCITVNKYQLVTQYLQHGSLFDQIHKKGKKFTAKQQFDLISDLVQGMVYLHNRGIIHRDLKSSNVLLSEDWKVKLCDFGLSGQKSKGKRKKNRIGTYQWMAPQVIRKQQIDFASDVYSFGVILWQMLSEKIPYQGLTETQIIGLVGYDQQHMLPIPQGNQFLISIMKKCLNRNISERPTFKQIQDQMNYIQQQNNQK